MDGTRSPAFQKPFQLPRPYDGYAESAAPSHSRLACRFAVSSNHQPSGIVSPVALGPELLHRVFDTSGQ